MNAHIVTRIVMVVAALAAVGGVSAQSTSDSTWNVVLNGRAVHLNASAEWNEENWGLGLEKEFNSSDRWVKLALVNGFEDSLGEVSYMVGGGLKRRFRFHAVADTYVDIGLIGFLMTRQDVNNNQPFPGVLPAMTVGTRRLALNFTYLPQSAVNELTHANRRDPDMNGIVFVQLKLNMGMFGFGDGRGPFLAANPDIR